MILALLAMLPFVVRAQEFDPEHRIAVEAVAGLSPIQTILEKYDKDLPEGGSYVNKMGPAVSLLGVYDLNDKWSVEGGLNFSRSIFDITLPDSPETVREHGTVTVTFLLASRYHWLRTPHATVFSGVGVAMTPKVMLAVFFPSPIPTITPIGATVGTENFYFTAELSMGGNTLGGLAGLGYRF